MNRTADNDIHWARHPAVAALVTLALLAIIGALDFITGPALDLSVAYFLAISYAAWSLGRYAAFVTAMIAETSTYIDQFTLVYMGEQTVTGAVAAIVTRLLIYLFVAEITFRLVRSAREERQAAEELQALNEELHRTYSRLDEDVRAAGLLQEGILAFSAPQIPGCEIGVSVRYAGPTGGDFADAGSLDGRVYACIADVSGKGTPAALFTAVMKYLLDEAHSREAPVAEVVATLNSALCRNLPSDRFVTLFYTAIDPSTGVAEYVNAGHLEGLLYRRSTDDIELAGSTTPLLGLCEMNTDVTASRLQLQHGDVLALYTDGAVEPKTISGERLGDEFIRQLVKKYSNLGAQEMAESITRTIEEQTAPESRDDLTVVCVKMTATERATGL
jgi:serine phosphatase RsbU (regulator of sigma subunit)